MSKTLFFWKVFKAIGRGFGLQRISDIARSLGKSCADIEYNMQKLVSKKILTRCGKYYILVRDLAFRSVSFSYQKVKREYFSSHIGNKICGVMKEFEKSFLFGIINTSNPTQTKKVGF